MKMPHHWSHLPFHSLTTGTAANASWDKRLHKRWNWLGRIGDFSFAVSDGTMLLFRGCGRYPRESVCRVASGQRSRGPEQCRAASSSVKIGTCRAALSFGSPPLQRSRARCRLLSPFSRHHARISSSSRSQISARVEALHTHHFLMHRMQTFATTRDVIPKSMQCNATRRQ